MIRSNLAGGFHSAQHSRAGLLGAGYGATKQNEKNMYVGDSPDEVSPNEKKDDKTTIVFDPTFPPRFVAKQILLGVCHTCALLVPSISSA